MTKFKRKWRRHDHFTNEIVSDGPMNHGRVTGGYSIIRRQSGMRLSAPSWAVYRNEPRQKGDHFARATHLKVCHKQTHAKLFVEMLDAGLPDDLLPIEGNKRFTDAVWRIEVYGESVEEIVQRLQDPDDDLMRTKP